MSPIHSSVEEDDGSAGRLRARLVRSPLALEAYRRFRAVRTVATTPGGFPSFLDLPSDIALRTAYEVVLQRGPDQTGVDSMLPALENGDLGYRDMVASLLGSEEFNATTRFWHLGPSLHASRCAFIRSLPKAKRIIDLGGTHQHRDEGALVAMGYPYPFEELIIVDLPRTERHEIYALSDDLAEVDTDLGPVRYRYHSMADLSDYEDESFDLVYSGQTFEHVLETVSDTVLAEAMRVLRPGGHLGLDTPNAWAARIQQPEFIDPDHEIEYDEPTLTAKLADAGFEGVSVQGLNHLGTCVTSGEFSFEEVARHHGVYAAASECYLLAYICRKPAVASSA